MTAIVILTAVPGHIERWKNVAIKTVHPLSPALGQTSELAGSVDDIRELVIEFGIKLRAREPGASFAILVAVRRGDRKPRGFDDALRHNGFGQDDFLTERVAQELAA